MEMSLRARFCFKHSLNVILTSLFRCTQKHRDTQADRCHHQKTMKSSDRRRKGKQLSSRKNGAISKSSSARSEQKLVIRDLEEMDSRRVVDMTYKAWYVGMAKALVVESIRMVEFLAVNLLTSVLAYVISQSAWIAGVWFVTWPFLGYLYVTFIVGSSEYTTGADTRPGSDFYQYWTQPNRSMLVAEAGDKLVGSISVIHVSPRHSIITRIVVDLDAAEHDVGVRLLLNLMSRCDRRGVQRLEMITSYPKKHSFLHGVYTKLGFVLVRTFYKGSVPFFKVPFYRYCRGLQTDEDKGPAEETDARS